MKAKLTIATGCFVLLIGLSGMAIGCSGSGCGDDSGGCSPRDGYGSCSCADPNCGSNSCLSGETCCAVFGNLGGFPKEVESEDYQYVSSNEFVALENATALYSPPPDSTATFKGE